MITPRFAELQAELFAALTIRPMSGDELSAVVSDVTPSTVRTRLAFSGQMGYTKFSSGKYNLTESGRAWLEGWKAAPRVEEIITIKPRPRADQILSVLKSEPRKSWTVRALMKKTGLNKKQVHGAVRTLQSNNEVYRVDTDALAGRFRGTARGLIPIQAQWMAR